MRLLPLALLAALPLALAGGARADVCPCRLPWQDRFVSWSPTGDYLAYLREGSTGFDDVRLVRPDGRADRFNGSATGRRVEWSPDGTAIAFESALGLEVELRTGPDVATLPRGDDAAWSRDGRLAYFHDRGLYVVEPGGSSSRLLVSDVRAPNGSRGPVWSPDGREIAFSVYAQAEAGPTRLEVVDAATGAARVVYASGNQAVNPSWSPDGRTLLFEANDAPWSRWRILRVATDGSGLADLSGASTTDDRFPVLSPDGRSLAFISQRRRVRGGASFLRYDLFVADAGGGHATFVARDVHPQAPAAWSPDSLALAYSAGRECNRWGIYVRRLDAPDDRRITNRCEFFARRRGGLLEGSPFKDFLHGGPGRDLIYGGNGPDVLTGGAGRDALYGGNGDDTLRARDGVRDHVDCGDGVDIARVDRRDVVARNCEHVLGPH